MSIEVGSLLRMAGYEDSIWLVLDEIAESVLVCNQETNHTMWAHKNAFEVIG